MEMTGKRDEVHGIDRFFFFFPDHLFNLPDLWGWSSKEVYRWKSRGGKSQRREEKRRREKIREEKESEERRCRCAKR